MEALAADRPKEKLSLVCCQSSFSEGIAQALEVIPRVGLAYSLDSLGLSKPGC
jgi:hypothetical protein